jgi:hypothetical protein
MSREMRVINGPSFRRLVFESPVLGESGFSSVFTMNEKIPDGIATIHKDLHVFQTDLVSIGKVDKDADNFLLVATMGSFSSPNYYYVIHYNVRKRKGRCVEFTIKEFFSSDLACVMFKSELNL